MHTCTPTGTTGRRFSLRSTLLGGAVLLCAAAGGSCATNAGEFADMSPAPDALGRRLDPSLLWAGENRARLDRMIAEHGAASPGYAASRKPVATFDWDNTVMKNDIGDATMFWLLRHGKIRQPADKNWLRTSPFLTPDAVAALSKACDGAAAAGAPLPTDQDAACATEIVTVYSQAKTTGGKDAFAKWDRRRMEPAYAWAAQLQAGYTAAESREFARQALDEASAAAQGSTQQVGTVTGLSAWVRIYAQQQDLIGALQASGWDVWIVSASPQPWVEDAASRVGIRPDHAIGVRVRDSGGVLTANLRGCGDVPDGENDGAGKVVGNSLITYIDGKRCFINKVVYGDDSAAALTKTADPARRQLFAAGDSDTDVTFLQDASVLKLVINRHKKEITCNALRNVNNGWLLQPMFIEPSPIPPEAYPCSKSACKDAAGNSVPCKDEDGMTIPDQTEPAPL